MIPIPTVNDLPPRAPTSVSTRRKDFTHVGEPEADIICSVCLDVLDRPKLHAVCGNMFCQDCVASLLICPLCRGNDLQAHLVAAPRLVLKQLDALIVRCNLCELQSTLGMIHEHLAAHRQQALASAGLASSDSSQTTQALAALSKRVALLETRVQEGNGASAAASDNTVRRGGIYVLANKTVMLSCDQNLKSGIKSYTLVTPPPAPPSWLLFSENTALDNREVRRSYVVVNSMLMITRLPTEQEGNPFYFWIMDGGVRLYSPKATFCLTFLPATLPLIGTTFRLGGQSFTFLDKDTVIVSDQSKQSKRVSWHAQKQGPLLLLTIDSPGPNTAYTQAYSFGLLMLFVASNTLVTAE